MNAAGNFRCSTVTPAPLDIEYDLSNDVYYCILYYSLDSIVSILRGSDRENSLERLPEVLL